MSIIFCVELSHMISVVYTEAEKDYFLGQNKELRNVLEKKNKEASEFVELITNLNGIVLHLKTQSSNLKADLSNSESNARSLATELENVFTILIIPIILP